MQQVPGTSGTGDTDKHDGEAAGKEEGGVGVAKGGDRRGGSGARGIEKVQGGGGLFVAKIKGAYCIISTSSPDDQAGLTARSFLFFSRSRMHTTALEGWKSTLRGNRHFSLVRDSVNAATTARPNANDLKGETTRKFTMPIFELCIVPNNIVH